MLHGRTKQIIQFKDDFLTVLVSSTFMKSIDFLFLLVFPKRFIYIFRLSLYITIQTEKLFNLLPLIKAIFPKQ